MSNAIVRHILENKDLEMLEHHGRSSSGWICSQFVRNAREEAGLSQQELADRLGVSRKHVQRMETEFPNATVATLVKVATACGGDLSIDFTTDN